MLKKLLANKKVIILIVVLALVIVGTFLAVLTMKDSKEDGKSGISIETAGDKDSGKSDDADAVYNEDGLEVEDTLDESVYTIDGSGDWDGSSEAGSEKEQGNTTDDAQSKDTEKEDSNDQGDEADGELDNDILVDDKVWTDPS